MNDDTRVSLGCGSNVFGTIVDDFHRPLGFLCKQCGVSSNHRWIFFLAAKPTASCGLNHHGLPIGKIEKLFYGFMDVIRALHRAHHGHRAVTRDRDHALRLDIELLLMGYAVLSFDNSVSGCESLINVSPADQEALENIVCA